MLFKTLLRRRMRTLLTALGVAIGIASIVGLGALAEGLDVGYNSMLTGSKADLVLSQPDIIDIAYSTVDEEAGEKLLAMPEVAAVSGMMQSFVQAEGNPFFFIFGYPEDSFILGKFQMIDGVALGSRQAKQMHGTPLILGSAAAEALKKKVGDTLRIQERPYRVVGIYQTGDAFEDGGAVLSLKDAQDLMGKTRQVSIFYIQLKDAALREKLAQRVARAYPDLDLSGTDDFADKQMMGDMMGVFVWVVAVLAILIGGVGMMNAQLTSVMERTREIGVLRSIGWSRGRVLLMILGESLLVCLLAGVLVAGLAFLILAGFRGALSSFGATGVGVGVLLQAFLTVLILGVIGGIYPAWRAARLTPVEALRYEGSAGSGRVRRLPFGGLAVQNLWQRSTRTLLTLCAIGITIGGIMAMDALVRGSVESFSTLSADAEIVLRQADVADTSLSAIDARIGSKIAAMPQVDNVSGVIFAAAVLPEQGGFFILQGYAPKEQGIRRFNVVEGERVNNNRQIMLGRTIADALHKSVGDTITLSSSRFRVVGIYESGTSWEEYGGVVSLRDAQTFLGRPRKVSIYQVKVRDKAQAEALVTQINAQFKDVHAALAGEFVEQMPDMQNTNAMMVGISLLAVLVGGVGVLNTMLMSVLERTREIGVLRALGWRRRSVLALILKEALWIGVLGGVIGVGVAFGMLGLLSLIPNVGIYITPLWEWDVFGRAFGVALCLGTLGGLYPALRATRLRPVEALRYE